MAINLVYSLVVKNIDNWCGQGMSCRFSASSDPTIFSCITPLCCRGHLGGMLGGALVAWLLGPRLVRQQEPSGSKVLPGPGLAKRGKPDAETSQISEPAGGRDRGRFVDQPPLPWLAYPEGTSFGMGGGRGRALPEARGGGRALEGASSPVTANGEGDRRTRSGKHSRA